MDFFGMSPLDPADRSALHNHVTQLAKEHGVEWREADINWLGAEADLEEGWFESPTLVTEFDYWVAVHEIAHFALKLPTFEDDGKTLIFENEEAVWTWAIEHGTIEPSAEASSWIVVSLNSHGDQVPSAEIMQRIRSQLKSDREPMRFKTDS